MRIVGGRFKGRALAGPKSDAIRPTSDRLREAIFNVLVHAYGDPVSGARVLDLFAGTGAMGLEALSRGAAFALLVDDASEARSLIRANVETLSAGGLSRVFRRDATKLGDAKPLEPFSLVFCDPPYGTGFAALALASARAGGWLAPAGSLAVVEERSGELVVPEGFVELERRRYGATEVTILSAGRAGMAFADAGPTLQGGAEAKPADLDP